MATNVLVTGQTFTPLARARLEASGYQVEVRPEHLDENGLIEAIRDKDAYIIGGVEFASGQVLRAAERLKVVAVLGVGYETFVDVAVATQLGLPITNTPHSNYQATAEMTLALTLTLVRKVPYINHLVKTGGWQDDIMSRNLKGRVLGIVGMGDVGRTVAEIASCGFGMNVLYANRTRKPEVEAATGARMVSLDYVLTSSNIVSLHVPLTNETHGMIGAREIELMRTDTILINAARPALVQPQALARALREHRIAGCAMDGYYVEPAPAPQNDPFGLLTLSDEQFIVTSHVAYLTSESIGRMCDLAAESVVRLLSGDSWKYVVNPDYAGHK